MLKEVWLLAFVLYLLFIIAISLCCEILQTSWEEVHPVGSTTKSTEYMLNQLSSCGPQTCLKRPRPISQTKPSQMKLVSIILTIIIIRSPCILGPVLATGGAVLYDALAIFHTQIPESTLVVRSRAARGLCVSTRHISTGSSVCVPTKRSSILTRTVQRWNQSRPTSVTTSASTMGRASSPRPARPNACEHKHQAKFAHFNKNKFLWP